MDKIKGYIWTCHVCIYIIIYIYSIWLAYSRGVARSCQHVISHREKKIYFFHILNPPWLLYSGNQIEKKQKKNTKQLGMMPFACWKSWQAHRKKLNEDVSENGYFNDKMMINQRISNKPNRPIDVSENGVYVYPKKKVMIVKKKTLDASWYLNLLTYQTHIDMFWGFNILSFGAACHNTKKPSRWGRNDITKTIRERSQLKHRWDYHLVI